MGITDEYTAFCFNEACAYIMAEINNGKKPKFKQIEAERKNKGKRFKSFKEYYQSIK